MNLRRGMPLLVRSEYVPYGSLPLIAYFLIAYSITILVHLIANHLSTYFLFAYFLFAYLLILLRFQTNTQRGRWGILLSAHRVSIE